MKSIITSRAVQIVFLLTSTIFFLVPESLSAYESSEWVGRWIIYRSGDQDAATLFITDPTRGDCLGAKCWELYRVSIVNKDGRSTGAGKIAGMDQWNSHCAINIPSADRRSTIRYDAYFYKARKVMSGTYQKIGTNFISRFCGFKQKK
jgi:hypothetical protein